MGDINVHGDVRYAEDHGFSHGWLYDSQMLGAGVCISCPLRA